MVAIIVPLLYLYPVWGLAVFLWFCRSSGPTRDFRIRGLIAVVVAATAALIFTPAMWGTQGFALFVPWWMYTIDKQDTLLFPWAGPVVFLLALAINVLTGSSSRPAQTPPPAQQAGETRSHHMLEGLVRPTAPVDDHHKTHSE